MTLRLNPRSGWSGFEEPGPGRQSTLRTIGFLVASNYRAVSNHSLPLSCWGGIPDGRWIAWCWCPPPWMPAPDDSGSAGIPRISPGERVLWQTRLSPPAYDDTPLPKGGGQRQPRSPESRRPPLSRLLSCRSEDSARLFEGIPSCYFRLRTPLVFCQRNSSLGVSGDLWNEQSSRSSCRAIWQSPSNAFDPAYNPWFTGRTQKDPAKMFVRQVWCAKRWIQLVGFTAWNIFMFVEYQDMPVQVDPNR